MSFSRSLVKLSAVAALAYGGMALLDDDTVWMPFVDTAPTSDTRPDVTPPPGAAIVCGKGRRVLEIAPNSADMAELAYWVCQDSDVRNRWERP